MSNPFEKQGNDRQRALARELGNARRQFAQAFAAGRAPVLDRFGRPLEVGSLIVWRPPQDLVFQVDQIDPVLDPNQAPGYIRVLISLQAPVTWQAGHAAPDIIVVGKTKDGHTTLDATQPRTETPPPDEAPSEEPSEAPPDDAPPGDPEPALPPVDEPPASPGGGGPSDEPGSGT